MARSAYDLEYTPNSQIRGGARRLPTKEDLHLPAEYNHHLFPRELGPCRTHVEEFESPEESLHRKTIKLFELPKSRE